MTSDAAAHPSHPYSRLTPDRVLDALGSIGLWGDGRMSALNSYENRVYLIHLEEPCLGHEQVVVKFYRPGRWSEEQIVEEHRFATELAETEVPVVAPLSLHGQTLHHHEGFAFAVSPRRGGRRPELDDPEVLEWIGRFLARLHACGEKAPFRHRPRLDIRSFGDEPLAWLLQHEMVAPEVRQVWKETVQDALAVVRQYPCLCGNGADDGIGLLRLHGDCHPGNVLWTPDGQAEAGPHFVDLDDARMGPAVQDLWMLLDGDRASRTYQLSALLDGYEQLRPFDRRELALIEPLRTLRLIHYSAWIARRWDDPAFPDSFPWFGGRDYWQGQVNLLHEQMEAMQEAPLMV